MVKKRLNNAAKIEQKGPTQILTYRLFKRFKKGGSGVIYRGFVTSYL
jgi:hypothetical protein